ncbi:MAG: PQQ-binding-like beta-propeller repeat protein [Fuerstiella sp.]|nr:PQQ-binding-like beta-propeller repeat protein [Fuerstiella sp.]
MKSLMTAWWCITLAASSTVPAADWNRFRGSDGQGVADSTVRLRWDAEKNPAWSLDLPGAGSSSPIVVGNRIFVTCYSGDDNVDSQRHLVCVDADSGKQLWQDSISGPEREDAYRGYLTEHGYASGTPVSDGKNVYCFFGKAGAVGWTVDGKKLWQKDLGQMSSNRRWGSGSSPVLFGNTLIVNASEESRAIFGLNAADGKELWKAEYDGLELCFATPVLVPGEGDVMEAVISMPGEVWGLNADNGKLRWFSEIGNGGNVTPGVVIGEAAFYTFGGHPQQQTNAIKRGGRRNVTDSHGLWQSRDSSYVATPLLHDNHLYWVTDRGQAFSVDATTGETVTRTRLTGLQSGGRPVYASPVKAGAHIFVVTRRSGTYVFEANPEMKQVSKNAALDDTDFNGTPAVADGRMYLRSNKTLYCIR